MKNKKVYSEFYFGVGFGVTTINGEILIILPFVVILVTEE